MLSFRSLRVLSLALLAAPVLAAAPVHAADAGAGAAIAARWCATCHAIGPQAQRAKSDAPSFPDIAARRSNLTGPVLAFELLSPHPQMPAISLTRVQAEDLAAYFASLR